MKPEAESIVSPKGLGAEYFAPGLDMRSRSSNVVHLDPLSVLVPPPIAFPRLVSIHRRKCPQCRGPLGGLAELRVRNGVVQAICRRGGCGFGIDLFWGTEH
ncbi:MAG: hypothetical protein WC969_07500 [Elusimicrobiota bacterium]|jgi:hypothetical protein